MEDHDVCALPTSYHQFPANVTRYSEILDFHNIDQTDDASQVLMDGVSGDQQSFAA